MAQLAVGDDGSFVPPMKSGEPAHLNLMLISMPEEIYVADPFFGPGCDPNALQADEHFDWVIVGGASCPFAIRVARRWRRSSNGRASRGRWRVSYRRSDRETNDKMLRQRMSNSGRSSTTKTSRFHFRPPEPLAPRGKARSQRKYSRRSQLIPTEKPTCCQREHHAFIRV